DQGNSIETLKASRKIQEEASIQKARQDVAKKIREDRLFSAFCSLEEELLPKAKDVEKQTQRNLLEKAWEITKRSNLNPSKLSNDFNKCVDSYLSRIISNLSAENQEVYSTPTKCKELRQGILSTPNFQSVSSPEAWRKHRKKTVMVDFCKAYEDKVHRDVLESFRNRQPLPVTTNPLARQYKWDLYDRKGLQERWGLWFHKFVMDDTDRDEETSLSYFQETFVEPIRKDAETNDLIKNPAFYVLKGNQYLRDNGCIRDAATSFQRAISLDDRYALPAYYNLAMAEASYSDKECISKQKVKDALLEAKFRINTVYRPELLELHGHIAAVGNKPDTFTHFQHHLDILFRCESYIDKSIAVIDEAIAKKHDILLEKSVKISSILTPLDNTISYTQAIAEIQATGLHEFFTVTRIPPIPWGTVIGIALIGIFQIVVGACLFKSTLGVYGGSWIISGISDIGTSIWKAISRDEQPLEDWLKDKCISLGVSVLCSTVELGWNKIVHGVNTLKENINKTKDFLPIRNAIDVKEGIREITTNLLKQALQKESARLCLSAVLENTVVKVMMEYIEKLVYENVINKLRHALLNNVTIQDGVSVDLEENNNQWQSKFIEVGEKILHKRESEISEIVKRICSGSCKQILSQYSWTKNTSTGEFGFTHPFDNKHSSGGDKKSDIQSISLDTLFTAAEKTKIAFDLSNLTDNFLRDYETGLHSVAEELKSYKEKKEDWKKNHGQDITSFQDAETKRQSHKQGKVLTSRPSPVLESSYERATVPTYQEGSGEAYDSRSKENYTALRLDGCQPSSTEYITTVFSQVLTGKLVMSIHSHFVLPASNKLSSWGIDLLYKKSDEELKSLIHTYREGVCKKHIVGQKLAKAKKEWSALSDDQRAAFYNQLSPETKHLLDKVGKDALTIDHAFAFSAALDAEIIIYNKSDGQCIVDIGKEKGRRNKKVISLFYYKDPETGRAHYTPTDPNIKVTSSGINNCMQDAILAHCDSDGEISPEVLKDRLLQHASENPKEYEDLNSSSLFLQRSGKSSQLYEGGLISERSNYRWIEAKFGKKALLEHIKLKCWVDMHVKYADDGLASLVNDTTLPYEMYYSEEDIKEHPGLLKGEIPDIDPELGKNAKLAEELEGAGHIEDVSRVVIYVATFGTAWLADKYIPDVTDSMTAACALIGNSGAKLIFNEKIREGIKRNDPKMISEGVAECLPAIGNFLAAREDFKQERYGWGMVNLCFGVADIFILGKASKDTRDWYKHRALFKANAAFVNGLQSGETVTSIPGPVVLEAGNKGADATRLKKIPPLSTPNQIANATKKAEQVFGKEVKSITLRQRNTGKGRAYQIEFKDGTKIDINPERVKMSVPQPRNPGKGTAKHNFKEKGGLPEGSEVIKTTGNGCKRTLTEAEKKILEDLAE
ncbi:hypothetical protein, partial [Cardinium endosymbiont of Culicoides punctatus]|uniref:hypothetical protein n=1 Tax=Cardinium endosymbiont of Culicoides punctatus TaxID=2304601 RepID=UPI001404BEFD